MTILPPSPFLTNPDNRFVLDEPAFMEAIEASPTFLSAPRAEYMAAVQIRPILETLAEYAQ